MKKKKKKIVNYILTMKKIDFCYKYIFLKPGKYLIKIINKKPLSIADSLYYNYNN